MNRKFVGLLSTFLLAGASVLSAAQQPMPMPAPEASSYLAGTAEFFLASCRSDLDDTKKSIAAIKASQPPRDAMATLQAFDTALLVAVRCRKSRWPGGTGASRKAIPRCRSGL